MPLLEPKDRLIVALDVETLDRAEALLAELRGVVTTFKVGARLFTAAGPRGALVAVGALIDRSGGSAAFGVKKVALATLSVPTYKLEDCPLCRDGTPAVKPGSRA